jgi:hypothetical protein
MLLLTSVMCMYLPIELSLVSTDLTFDSCRLSFSRACLQLSRPAGRVGPRPEGGGGPRRRDLPIFCHCHCDT